MPKSMPLLLTVDGAEYPLDFGAIDGAQVTAMRDRGIAPLDLANRLDTNTATLVEVVALMCVSLQQRDRPADFDWLAKRVTLGSDVEIEWVGAPGEGEEPQPAPVPASPVPSAPAESVPTPT